MHVASYYNNSTQIKTDGVEWKIQMQIYSLLYLDSS